MAKLKLGAIEDDKPVRVTIDLPAALHRDLVAYAQALSSEAAQNAVDHAKLIATMLKNSRRQIAPSPHCDAAVRRLRSAKDSVRREPSRNS